MSSTANTPRFPVRPLVAGIVLTLGLVGFATWSDWSTRRGLREVLELDLEVTRLSGTIIHLDEVLTMSARMAGATGEARWEQRYRRFEPELDRTIKALMRLDPAGVTQVSSTTDEANLKLVDMENRAFELVRSGQREEAQKVLFSADYETQKKIYAQGSDATLLAMRSRVDDRVRSLNERALAASLLDLLILLLLAAGWMRIFIMVRAHLRARAAAEAALDRANRATQELAALLEVRVEERTKELSNSNHQLQATLGALHETQSKLVEKSREAGMAEVATGVLHNVGNVLNNITVSTNLIANTARGSKVGELARAAKVLRDHQHELGSFMTSDPKGKQLGPFLCRIADALSDERNAITKEIEELIRNIEHVSCVVTMQQKHARKSVAVLEQLCLNQIIDDAIRINEGSFTNVGATIERDFAEMPQLTFDKHLILQILHNLLSNARHALMESDRREKHLTVSTACENGRVQIEVRDNGVGIPPESLTKIFAHGFTTKENGHGFGLHASALAAAEMGGTLSCRSDGPNCGAAFSLAFPLSGDEPKRPEVEAQ